MHVRGDIGSIAMRFEGRLLKPYAESVEAATLKIGSVYFTVTFFDDEMTTPEMKTLVYRGRSRSASEQFPSDKIELCDEGDLHVFQMAHEFHYGQPDELRGFSAFSEEELAGVYDFDEALNVLLRCSLRRAGSAA